MQEDRLTEGSLDLRRRQLLAGAAGAALMPWVPSAQAAGYELEGVELAETVMAHGQKLVLDRKSVV